MAAHRQTQVNGICDKMRAGKIDGCIVTTIQKKAKHGRASPSAKPRGFRIGPSGRPTVVRAPSFGG